MVQRNFVILSIVAISIIAGENNARAQAAWVGAQGELSLNLNYNFAQSDKVIGDSMLEFPNAGIRSHEVILGVEYVPVNHLAVDVALPYLALQYIGDKMIYAHPAGGSYDDGSYHGTLTDFRSNVRYQVLEEPLAIGPFVGVSIPVANYETVGNAVAGRHLKQLHMGVAVGRIIGDAAYVHLAYTFSLVERYTRVPDTGRFGQNRSDAAFTVGYKLLEDRLDVNLGVNGRVTHGGLDFSDPTTTPGEFLYHDPVLHENVLLVGPGIGYQITDALAVNLVARFFVWGMNTQNASVFGLGLTWSAL